MNSLFACTQGLRLENLITGALFYLAENNYHDQLEKIFEDNNIINLCYYGVEKQKYIKQHDKKGFIDLYFESEKQQIIIENKFEARFTNIDGVNQIFKYHEYLSLHNTRKKKYIIIIGLRSYEDYYCTVLSDVFKRNIKAQSLINIDGVYLYIKFWDDVKMITDDNEIYQNIMRYINEEYFKYTIIESKEYDGMKNKDIIRVIRIRALIDETYNYLEREGFVVEEFSSTFNSTSFEYGFYITNSNIKIWFGIWSDIPEDLEPLFIQTITDIDPSILGINGFAKVFSKEGNELLGGNYIKFINISEVENCQKMSKLIINVLTNLTIASSG